MSTTANQAGPHNAGVLLVGHGTRNRRGQSQFLQLAQQVRSSQPLQVEPAYLELAEPTIEEGIQRLVAAGIGRLIVAPLLLFAAGHAKEDVPSAVRGALERCGVEDLPITQAKPFGCHPLLLELAQRRLAEAMPTQATASASDTLLIVVGRGSSDESATAELQAFARIVADRAAMPRLQVAFVAMARPAVSEVLAEVPPEGIHRVIVQPHLLFHGEVIDGLRRQVEEVSSRRRQQEWVLTRVLADDRPGSNDAAELLTAATVDLIDQAAAR